MTETIERIRNFNRFYFNEIGLVDDSELPDGLSLTQARILTEIGRNPEITARQIAKGLKLDPGYLSRILAEFEKKRMISRQPSRADKRASLLKLTARGGIIFEQLNATAEAQIRLATDRLPPEKRVQLVAAMEQIQSLMSAPQRSAPLVFRQLALGDAGWIVHRHGAIIAKEFGWDERFEALCAQIMADFIRNYNPVRERSWVVEREGKILGSLLLVTEDDQTAKLRLLYVEPDARGMGLATRLFEKAIRFARDKHYTRVRLFTTSANESARRMYVRMGFRMVSEETTDAFCGDLTGEIWELAL